MSGRTYFTDPNYAVRERELDRRRGWTAFWVITFAVALAGLVIGIIALTEETACTDCMDGLDGLNGFNGTDGLNGTNGFNGTDGLNGTCLGLCVNGTDGRNGTDGINGTNGDPGPPGPQGPQGTQGLQGPQGAQGPQGIQGPTGPQGTPKGILSFATFYSLSPPDNNSAIAPGMDVQFPQNGPTSASAITRLTNTSFNLGLNGTYFITFQVSIAETGQLILTANGIEYLPSLAGRNAVSTQIVNMFSLFTNGTNTIITIRNPTENIDTLSIMPHSGGRQPVSAVLNIMQIA